MSAAPSPGPGRREERRLRQHEISRLHLLDAAEEAFGRKGFYETPLREVADLAEYAVGSVYSFFENKDDLFRQIFIRRGDEFMPALHAILDDIDVGPVEQLHALIDFQVGFFRDRPHFGRLYLRYFSTTALPPDREIDAVMQERYEDAMRLQAGLFRRGQRSGVLHPGDPDVLARLLSGLVSAYQALDPEVISDEPNPGEQLPLSEFHALVDRTFVAG